MTLGNGATLQRRRRWRRRSRSAADRLHGRGACRRRSRRRSACASTPSDTAARPVLDPAKVAGKIVVCDRGVNARVNKSLAVQRGRRRRDDPRQHRLGQLVNADLHFVPTVHLHDTDRAAVKAYAAGAGATATINAANMVFNAPAPFTASFSSRGPLQRRQRRPAQARPDGARPGHPGRRGAARQPRPSISTCTAAPRCPARTSPAWRRCSRSCTRSWSPMAIKSALMTTRHDVLDGGPRNTNPVVIFRQGAGPRAARTAPRTPAWCSTRASTTGWRFLCGTATAGPRCHLQRPVGTPATPGPERHERGLHRHRRHGRHRRPSSAG